MPTAHDVWGLWRRAQLGMAMLDLPPEAVPLSTERRNRQPTRLVAADDAIGLCSPRIQVGRDSKTERFCHACIFIFTHGRSEAAHARPRAVFTAQGVLAATAAALRSLNNNTTAALVGSIGAAKEAKQAQAGFRAPPTAAAVQMHQISHIHLGNALLNRVHELKAFTVSIPSRQHRETRLWVARRVG